MNFSLGPPGSKIADYILELIGRISIESQKLNIIGDPAEGWEAVGEIIIIILWEWLTIWLQFRVRYTLDYQSLRGFQ